MQELLPLQSREMGGSGTRVEDLTLHFFKTLEFVPFLCVYVYIYLLFRK